MIQLWQKHGISDSLETLRSIHELDTTGSVVFEGNPLIIMVEEGSSISRDLDRSMHQSLFPYSTFLTTVLISEISPIFMR